MKKTGRTVSSIRGNEKGYSLIELIVVITMIVALTSIAIGGFSTLSHARATKAASSLDSMIAQSKVNALSGQENELIVRYDDDENSYVAELHSIDKSGNIASTYYENMVLGNSLLNIYFGDDASKCLDKDNTKELHIRFNRRNGGLLYCWLDADGEAHDETPSECNIHVKFGSDNIVQIFKLTGEHHVVGQDT